MISERDAILWAEIERGQKDKTRTLKDIDDCRIRDILISGYKTATEGATAMAAVPATEAAATAAGAVIGAAATTGTAAVSGVGISSLVVGGGTLGTIGAGAAAGSVVPVVGTVIGAGIGLAASVLIASSRMNRKEQEKERLKQETIAKQNAIIKDLCAELEELKKKLGRYAEQNERYRYIISMLQAAGAL